MIPKNPIFYFGVVEDRMDPLMLGRARVRILGLHTHDKAILPTEDLPWAYKIQQITSGAMNGIGNAPVGAVEGTWVIVQFIDPDKQIPFVVGSIGGIPYDKKPPQSALDLFDLAGGSSSSATVINPAELPDDLPLEEQVEQAKSEFPTRSPKDFKISEEGIAAIKKREGFGGKPPGAPYQDSAGYWTIGYGNRYLADGSPVTASTKPITEKEADTLLRKKLPEYEAPVKNNVRVPITQSMYDSLVSLTWNAGGGGLNDFAKNSGLNSGRYEQAAAALPGFRNNGGTLSGRRLEEQKQFLKNGIPSPNGIATVQETPQSIEAAQASSSAGGSGTGSSSYKRSKFNGLLGFKDPFDKYPLDPYLKEPDTNRLARHQKIRETIVYLKEIAEHKNVPKANGGSWSQSPTPYNAIYPFNNVYQSESGHFLEFDDTLDKERIHLYHKAGTYIEVDHNGTKVTRVVGDNYEIFEMNGKMHVIGALDICVEGAHSLRVENTLDVEVHGATNINIHDSAKLNIAGNLDMTVGGNFMTKVLGTYGLNASSIVVNKDIGVSPKIASHLRTIQDIPSEPSISQTLYVKTRGEEAAMKYDSPDDGDPSKTVVLQAQDGISSGTATVGEETKNELNNIKQTPVPETPCGPTPDYNEKISSYYKLSDLTRGNQLKDQNGLTFCQIKNNLKSLAVNVLDPLKAKYPDMKINSGLRSDGSNSQHNKGQAVDISFDGLTREQLHERAKEIQKTVPHDQMILEYAEGSKGWIHISNNPSGNRNQTFTMNNHSRVSNFGTFAPVS